MTVDRDIEAERGAMAESLETVGPQARTACGGWTAFDLAAHVVSAERAIGVPVFVVRTLAARGVRFAGRPEVADTVIRLQRRDGFEALIGRLRKPPPRLLRRPSVAALTLFEVWMHHDDLTGANGLAHAVPEHLADAIPWLVRYQAKRLPTAQLTVCTKDGDRWVLGSDAGPHLGLAGPTADLVRSLAGRRPLIPPNIEGDAPVAQQLGEFVGRI